MCSLCFDWNARAAHLRDLDAMQIRSMERRGGNSDVVPATVILIVVALIAIII
jgi:hypothetical protein